MKKIYTLILTIFLILTGTAPATLAEVEWHPGKTLAIGETPIDTAVSANSKWIFVLTDTGKIHIYSASGSLNDTIDVGRDIDSLQTGKKEDILYLQSKKKKTVDIIMLDFIRHFDLTGSPEKGPADAPVTIVEFSDFQCPYCSRLVGTLDDILKKNPKTVRLVFKHFPLSSHRYSVKAAMAAMVAKTEQKFWPFHDALFKNHSKLNDQKIDEIVKELKLDPAAFDKKMKDPTILNQIRQDYKQGLNAGVSGTPTLYINGKPVRDRSAGGIQKMIDEALKNKKQKS